MLVEREVMSPSLLPCHAPFYVVRWWGFLMKVVVALKVNVRSHHCRDYGLAKILKDTDCGIIEASFKELAEIFIISPFQFYYFQISRFWSFEKKALIGYWKLDVELMF